MSMFSRFIPLLNHDAKIRHALPRRGVKVPFTRVYRELKVFLRIYG